MSNARKAKTERVPATYEQLAELLGMVVRIMMRIFQHLDKNSVQYWIGKEGRLSVVLNDTFGVEVVDEKIIDWTKFYQEVFGLNLDPAEIKLPAEREGFGWIVLVAKGLARNQVFEVCAKRFKSWRYYDDLDKAVTVNDRKSTEAYAVRVRDCVEADECHKGKSANTATKAGIKGITNLERMLLELWYHWKSQGHLDKETLTICSGSRYAGGGVPGARWGGDGFRVDYVDPDHQRGDWRVREVVSLEP